MSEGGVSVNAAFVGARMRHVEGAERSRRGRGGARVVPVEPSGAFSTGVAALTGADAPHPIVSSAASE